MLYEQFLKNQEKLWDLAAITAAPTIYQMGTTFEKSAYLAYDLADALMTERRMRFLREVKPDAK